MTIYVDVLLTLNYIVNLTLLSAAARIFALPCSRKRLCLGAFVGALGTLWIFVPYPGPLIQTGYKCLLTCAVSISAFGWRPWQRALRGIVATTLSAIALAGAMLGVEILFAPASLFYRDGVVYANVRPITILLWTAALYGLLWLLTPLFWGKAANHSGGPVPVEVQAFGGTTRFRVLPDSGNLLREPFSGLPVMVCAPEVLRPLGDIPAHKLRLIPCATVTGQQTLQGFLPEAILLPEQSPPAVLEPLYIAAGSTSFPADYQGVAHPTALSSTRPIVTISQK